MEVTSRSRRNSRHRFGLLSAATGMAVFASTGTVWADGPLLVPGNLVVSRSVYSAPPSLIAVGQALPGGGTAVADGTYPNVWNNAQQDGSFGVTSPIYLDQYSVSGAASASLVNTLAINPNQVSTSFSSKSELALNLSTDGKTLTFMAYVSPPNTLDVSNSNTPGNFDPTNPVAGSYYRAVAQVDASGNLQVTPVNAYSGNNGRAVIAANGAFYMVGNSNNGTGTPANIINDTGVQMTTPAMAPTTTMVGNYSITQNGYPADKAGKDNNFRGETIHNNTLYVTKGSGGNGINTVYQVGNSGSLPALSTAASTPIAILPGFPTGLAKNDGATGYYPFGLFFGNDTTLYVADEGDGKLADAAADPHAGIQKWRLINGTWQLQYTLQNGLKLGIPYTVTNYPAALSPATDGLRNLTGTVNPDGTVTLYAVTSTVSASGDQGADPNQLVAITDNLATGSLPAAETFTTLESAAYGQVLRGVAFTPGTTTVPEPASISAIVVIGALLARRRRA